MGKNVILDYLTYEISYLQYNLVPMNPKHEQKGGYHDQSYQNAQYWRSRSIALGR